MSKVSNSFCKSLQCIFADKCEFCKKDNFYFCKKGNDFGICVYITGEGKITPEPYHIYAYLNRNEFIILAALIKYERQET